MDCQATSFVSVTQCDPTSGIDPICWPATVTDDVSCAAKRLAPQERQDLVIQVLAGTETVSELARQHEVSRKFLYRQVHSAEPHAQRINQQHDLSRILIGLLDEIFQARDPVLVGVDAASTFCFLLSPEEHRDADTWGIRLLELVDRGFA